MSKPMEDGGSAFPFDNSYYPNGEIEYGQNGMSLRDYFAGQALAGIMATDAMAESMDAGDIGIFDKFVSSACYKVADAMLAARKAEL